jgi:hypothetical protein
VHGVHWKREETVKFFWFPPVIKACCHRAKKSLDSQAQRPARQTSGDILEPPGSAGGNIVTDANIVQNLAPSTSSCLSEHLDLPRSWFDLARQLYPGLTAPSVRLLKQGADSEREEIDLERVVLARAFGAKG